MRATRLGLDIRYVMTNIKTGTPEWLYAALYCASGQAENLVKLHNGQLASDRTSCRNPTANQMRLVLHTAAYWLMLTVRDAIPTAHSLARAEFTTIRLRLLKLRARIRLAFPPAPRPTCCAISRPRSPRHQLERRGCNAPTNPLPSLNRPPNNPAPHASKQMRDPTRQQHKTPRHPPPDE